MIRAHHYLLILSRNLILHHGGKAADLFIIRHGVVIFPDEKLGMVTEKLIHILYLYRLRPFHGQTTFLI